MADSVTVIGRGARVRGRVVGDGDLEVEGFVSGEIAVSGNVTVDAPGIVGASIRGRRVVVRGAVQGDLVGSEAVILEEGARVVGDVRSPRIAIAEGALMRGHVQTEDGASALPVARARSVAKPEAVPVRVEVAHARPIAAAKETPVARAPAQAASARRPPPPVVPVLKKVKGHVVKKKE